MTTGTTAPDRRRAELAERLGVVRQRIAAASAAAGRDPGEVTLTVVTKFFPASDVRLLAGLGVRHVGENRHQEAVAKAVACGDLDLCWHYIGGLQSNKAAAVAGYADVVESLDRAKLLRGLARGAAEHARTLDVLVQVDLD
ncbi:MAG: YggS family pyridoxal phosphate-dependent enzyme, partial [Nocardioidaceae bacterium]